MKFGFDDEDHKLQGAAMKQSLLFLFLVSIFSISCAQKQLASYLAANPDAMRLPNTNSTSEYMSLGRFAMIQGPTSDSEAYFSSISPRYKNYTYVLVDAAGKEMARVQPYEAIEQANYTFWKIDKFHFTGLTAGQDYGLHVVEKPIDKLDQSMDFRKFKSMDLNQTHFKFVVGSCQADDHRFSAVRKAIWNKVVQTSPDFIIMNGDVVYVDSFEFVKRETKTHKTQEWEIWGRYMDSFQTLEIFRSQRLIPIVANWDDHDMGTNNSDINFSGKDHAKRVFKALFHAPDIKGVFKQGVGGVSSAYTLFGQKFIMMDGRYFRQPPGTQKDPNGHLGKRQHEWIISEMNSNSLPTWLVMGDQFFQSLVEVGEGEKKKIVNETFIGDHPVQFDRFLKDVKDSKSTTVFISGDVHFSEISTVDKNVLGYPTFELTASPYHSYIFGGKNWENPRRVVATKEHNFMLVEADTHGNGIKANVRAIGAGAEVLFEKEIVVTK